MNEKEKALINLMQEGIPLVSRPFKVLGDSLGMSESETLSLYKQIEKKDYIRRFGGIVDISKLGIVSTLVGMRVDPDSISYVASLLNDIDGVTHNYERDDEYNLWFTLMSKNQDELLAQLLEIEKFKGVDALINLPAKEKFKTKVILTL
jgi:DNA-binding Lrp family transcriptional regulator